MSEDRTEREARELLRRELPVLRARARAAGREDEPVDSWPRPSRPRASPDRRSVPRWSRSRSCCTAMRGIAAVRAFSELVEATVDVYQGRLAGASGIPLGPDGRIPEPTALQINERMAKEDVQIADR